MKRHNGFTLIEMMLVIAVVAIMASFAIMTYRRHTETARIDKIAIEIQHVLEAALAFNVDHSQWPEAHKSSTCATTPPMTTSSFVNNYIPNRNVQSSYGSYFCWSAQGESKKNARLFWVALKVPHNNVQLAKRIAARLPNAVITSIPNVASAPLCDGNVCYVRAEVVQPAATSNNSGGNGGMIVATGDCPSHNDATNSNINSSVCNKISSNRGTKYRISFNACPNNELPRVTVFPNFVRYPKDGWPGFTVKDIDAERTNDACTVTLGDDGKKKQHCDVAVHVTFCTGKGPYKCGYEDTAQARHQGSAGASYIVACVPRVVL